MTSMRTVFGFEDLEETAKMVYGLMEREASEADIQPWPRWNRSAIVTEAVQSVAFKVT